WAFQAERIPYNRSLNQKRGLGGPGASAGSFGWSFEDHAMATDDDRIIKVYQAGELTVVGFGGRDVLDDVNVAVFKAEIAEVVRSHDCRVLAVDLTGVKLVPSGLLGLLASLR